jgi:predicted ABC-type transport system involved in lysophospholipase L1 biosynthesis ATPase subunit
MVTHDNDLAKRAHRTVQLADGEIINEWQNNLGASYALV